MNWIFFRSSQVYQGEALKAANSKTAECIAKLWTLFKIGKRRHYQWCLKKTAAYALCGPCLELGTGYFQIFVGYLLLDIMCKFRLCSQSLLKNISSLYQLDPFISMKICKTSLNHPDTVWKKKLQRTPKYILLYNGGW